MNTAFKLGLFTFFWFWCRELMGRILEWARTLWGDNHWYQSTVVLDVTTLRIVAVPINHFQPNHSFRTILCEFILLIDLYCFTSMLYQLFSHSQRFLRTVITIWNVLFSNGSLDVVHHWTPIYKTHIITKLSTYLVIVNICRIHWLLFLISVSKLIFLSS